MSSLDRLWAGWRSAYIESITSRPEPEMEPGSKMEPRSEPAQEKGPAQEKAGSCVFCGILGSGLPDEETYILWRHPDGTAVALLNAYPYGSGHLMVMPTRHIASPEDLAPEEGGALWQGVTEAVAALRAAYSPEGLNLGANLGRAAGAGIPDHFHMHALPRWGGDTNFMTSVAETRVLPEPLSTSYRKIVGAWPGVGRR